MLVVAGYDGRMFESPSTPDSVTGPVSGVIAGLRGLVEGADAETLAGVVSACRTVVTRFEGVLVCCADRAVELETAGAGPPTEELLSGGSGSSSVTTQDGRQMADRAVLSSEFETVSRVVRDGSAPAGSIDSLCRALRGMEGDERAALIGLDSEIAHRITVLPVASFARWIHRRKRALASDDGEKTLEEQQQMSELSWWRTRDGRLKIYGDFDALQGDSLIDQVKHQARTDLARHCDVEDRDAMSPNMLAAALIDLVAGGALSTSSGGVPVSNRITVLIDHQTASTGQAHEATVC